MTDTQSTAAASSSGTTTGANILSEKVMRALEVRTDTPAMKCALEALAQLPEGDSATSSPIRNRGSSVARDGGGSGRGNVLGGGHGSVVVDSRSVRVAIEQDALHQALLMQDELKALVDTISELRRGVSEVAAVANRVNQAIDTSAVVTTAATPSTTATANTEGEEEKEESAQSDVPATGTSSKIMSPEDSLEQERQLAGKLADAFRERDEAMQRAEAVNSFLEKFDLSENDSRLLDQYNFEDFFVEEGMENVANHDNAMAFLDALVRVRKMRNELGKTFDTSTATASALLGHHDEISSSDSAQRLGATSAIRMMESLATKQENAYERLYHWLQKYLNLNSTANVPTSSSSSQQQNRLLPTPPDEDAMDEALIHPFVRRSLHVLRHVPAFYSHTLELIATSRRSEETRRFLLALTSGYNGMAPIEMKAHDPVNYVGDMLAFVFRAFSVEADVARGLVKYEEAGNENEGGDKGTDESKDQQEGDDVDEKDENEDVGQENEELVLDKPMTAADILAQSMSGISRPLQSRILQVVAALARRPDDDDDDVDDDGGGLGSNTNLDVEEEGAVARSRVSSLYSICGLLLFYHSAVNNVVKKIATSSKDIPDIPVISAIFICLQEASTSYAASIRVYGAMLESLTMISGETEASLAHLMMANITDVRVASPGFSADVECPPQVESSLSLKFACETLIDAALSSCRSLDDAVTLKVSVTTAKKAGLSSSLVQKFNVLISEKEQVMIDELVDTETKDVLDVCGLGSVTVAFQRMQEVHVEGMTMSTHPGLSQEEVESAMKEFYSSLYSPPLPSFEKIKDPVLRKEARSKIASNIVQTYSMLYEAMSSEKGGYDDLSFFGHSPSQVKTLFSA